MTIDELFYQIIWNLDLSLSEIFVNTCLGSNPLALSQVYQQPLRLVKLRKSYPLQYVDFLYTIIQIEKAYQCISTVFLIQWCPNRVETR